MIKMLVVDDESGVCDVIQKTFSYMGFPVFAATNTRRAMDIFTKERPRIVFLDLLMPDGDGGELLKKFKAIDPDVIVIVVTVQDPLKAKDTVMDSGADEYVQKPFSHNYLRDIVTRKIQVLLQDKGSVSLPSILIVDDEPALRLAMKNFIEPRFSCRILEAENAALALEQTKSAQPDIILLDIKMPGASGLDILEDIKKASPASHIVIVSAWNSGEAMEMAVAKGAVDYITKPVSLAALDEKLRLLLLGLGKLKITSFDKDQNPLGF